MSRLTGTVKWFNNSKGYGFLGRNDGGADVFAHYTSIELAGYKTLREGESVTFEVVPGERGRPQAEKVIPLRDKKSPPPSSPLPLGS